METFNSILVLVFIESNISLNAAKILAIHVNYYIYFIIIIMYILVVYFI